MSSKYWEARISKPPSTKPRKVFKSPDRQIALRKEYIAETKSLLILRPQGNAQSAVAYKITDEDGIPQFSVTRRKFSSNRWCREFHDESGLPLFELHRKFAITNIWSVTLPGNKDDSIATGTPRWSLNTTEAGNLNFSFENAAALDSKRGDEKSLTLQVQRHGAVLASFDVVDGNRKIAEVRESILHNERLVLMHRYGKYHHPVLDLTIMPGVDMSLVRLR